MRVDVIFVRHGETRFNRELRCQGRIDAPLNEDGIEQMKRTAAELRDVDARTVYTSPLKRAVDSARIVAEPRGLDVKTLEWLIEMDHGDIDGMNREEADAIHPGLYDQWYATPESARFPNGESLGDVARRAGAGFLELASVNPGRTVIVVCHQIIIGVLRCMMDEKPFSELWDGKLVNGGVMRRTVDSEMAGKVRRAIEAMNG